MTHIVPPTIKTKKELKEEIKAGRRLYFQDPSLFNPQSWEVNSTSNLSLPKGSTIYCTNHPKRSWFAQITRKQDGTYRVS